MIIKMNVHTYSELNDSTALYGLWKESTITNELAHTLSLCLSLGVPDRLDTLSVH